MNSNETENTSIKDLRGALAYQDEELIAHYSEKYSTSLDESKLILKETIKFLILRKHMGTPISPSQIQDTMWHEFILHDTKKYMEFCKNYIGAVIHHKRGPVIDRRESIYHARDIFTHIDEIDDKIWNAVTPGQCNGDCDADCA